MIRVQGLVQCFFVLVAALFSTVTRVYCATGDTYVRLSSGYGSSIGSYAAQKYSIKQKSNVAMYGHTSGDSLSLVGKEQRGVAQIALGYQFMDNCRIETGYSYDVYAPAFSVVVNSDDGAELRLQSYNISVGAYYEILNNTEWTPFVGIRFGFDSVAFNLDTILYNKSTNTSAFFKFNGVNSAGAWNSKMNTIKEDKSVPEFIWNVSGSIGLSYKFNHAFDIETAFDIKYLRRIPNQNFKSGVNSIMANAKIGDDITEFISNSLKYTVSIGVKMFF